MLSDHSGCPWNVKSKAIQNVGASDNLLSATESMCIFLCVACAVP